MIAACGRERPVPTEPELQNGQKNKTTTPHEYCLFSEAVTFVFLVTYVHKIQLRNIFQNPLLDLSIQCTPALKSYLTTRWMLARALHKMLQSQTDCQLKGKNSGIFFPQSEKETKQENKGIKHTRVNLQRRYSQTVNIPQVSELELLDVQLNSRLWR